MKILLIRHGMTEGNRARKYIGITDEPLCPEGIEQLKLRREEQAFLADLVFVSPMLRCRQTADYLFEGNEQIIIPEFREMDFGEFEGRGWAGDLEHDPAYLAWLETDCEGPVPGGEQKADFTKRCAAGFCRALKIASQTAGSGSDCTAAFVVHGGTVMSILSVLGEGQGEYYSYHTENGHGYQGDWDGKKILGLRKI